MWLPVGSPLWIPQPLWPFWGGGSTFLANQTPLACVTHSREWIPVSIQMAGRLVPPVLNWESTERGLALSLSPLSPLDHNPPNPHLEHVEGPVLGRAADLQLAHQVGVLGRQQVYETVNLGTRRGDVTPSSPPWPRANLFPQNATNLVLSHLVYGVVGRVVEGVGVARQLAAAAEHLPLLFIQQGLGGTGRDEPPSHCMGSPLCPPPH